MASAHYSSNSAGRYCHIPLTARTSLWVTSTCFDSLKEFLGGQHFSTDGEVKQAVLAWFSRTDTSFCAEAFQALVKRWDKCINVAGGGGGGICWKVNAVSTPWNLFFNFYKLKSPGLTWAPLVSLAWVCRFGWGRASMGRASIPMWKSLCITGLYIKLCVALSWLRRLVFNCSPRMPGLITRTADVRCVVVTVALRQDYFVKLDLKKTKIKK